MYPESLKILALDTRQGAATLMLQMSGAANYYAPGLHVLRFDAVSADGWTAMRAWQARERATIGAVLYGAETQQFLGRIGVSFPCSWESRGHVRQVTFWICPP